jgi:catechol 2,3-dioxygenase-like lactoylglutathione lyase family enzyme
MATKQQFNVYLPPSLVRRIKHAAIDSEQSLSQYVADALAAFTGPVEVPMSTDFTPLTMMPILYVTDMETSLRFYEGLGFTIKNKGVMWSELRLGAGTLALHYTETLPPQPSRIALAFVTHISLEELIADLQANAIHIPYEIADEAFGRSLLLVDPDDNQIQINEHDPDLYQ